MTPTPFPNDITESRLHLLFRKAEAPTCASDLLLRGAKRDSQLGAASPTARGRFG